MPDLPPGIRLRRPGYYEVRVYAGVDPVTKKARKVSRGVRGTLKDAKDARARLLISVTDNGPTFDTGSLAGLFDATLNHLEHVLGREATTLAGYRAQATRIVAVLGNVELRKLTAGHLNKLYAELRKPSARCPKCRERRPADDVNKKCGCGREIVAVKGASPATVRRYHAFVHRALKYGKRSGWVRENVADDADPPPSRPKQVAAPDDQAVARLIEAGYKADPTLGVALLLLASLGNRRGELCGLRWSDVDLVSGRVVLRSAVKKVTGKPLIVGGLKTHQERALTLDAGTVAALNAHRKLMDDRAGLAGTVLRADGFVISDSFDAGQPWRPDRLTAAVRRLRARSGYTGRLHDLRHWNASMLLNRGEDIVTVAGRHGHADGGITTLKVYAHYLPAGDLSAAAKVGAALHGDELAERRQAKETG